MPKNSYHYNSFFDQDRFEQCELHFSLLCIQSPEKLRISEGSTPAYGHDPAGDAPLKLCFLFAGQVREKLRRDFSEVGRRELSYDISVSKPRDTCIPTLSDLGVGNR